MSAKEEREYETLQEAFDSMPKVINEPCVRRLKSNDMVGGFWIKNNSEVLNWRKVVEE